MPDHFSAIEFFLTEQHAQQRRFAGTISSDKPNLDVVNKRRFRTVQQVLFAVTLERISNLQQHSHRFLLPPGIIKAGNHIGCGLRIEACMIHRPETLLKGMILKFRHHFMGLAPEVDSTLRAARSRNIAAGFS
jgi:hypothetical protein